METLVLSVAAGKEASPGGTQQRFEELLDGVLCETLHAAAHWNLLKRLDAAISGYSDEVEQSNDFWGFTLKAHYDAVLFYLGRLYAQDGCGFSLGRLVSTIKSSGRWREESVDRDLESVSLLDGRVERLNGLRNRVLSVNAPRAVRLADLCSPALSVEEIETLLERAAAIGNKCCILRWGVPSSRRMASGGDYSSLVSLLERGLASAHAEHAAQIARSGDPPPAWSPADSLASLS